jgi:transcriptional regulator with GAF, ATPase, and Fis domain
VLEEVMPMHTGRPDPLERLDTTTEAVRGLQDITAAEESLDEVLMRVAATAVHAIPDADAVTITVLIGDQPRTVAWTDERMVDIDARQYAADRGPCLDAARTQSAVLRAAVGERRRDWPEFATAAEHAGVHAYLSSPLLVDSRASEDLAHGQELVGSLNIYSTAATAFDPFDEGLLQLYTAAAAAAITNARRRQDFRRSITQLEAALTSRAEIDQAKGVLMAVHGCTADEAFARLVEQSQRTNTKVSKLAHDLLASLRASPGAVASSVH